MENLTKKVLEDEDSKKLINDILSSNEFTSQADLKDKLVDILSTKEGKKLSENVKKSGLKRKDALKAQKQMKKQEKLLNPPQIQKNAVMITFNRKIKNIKLNTKNIEESIKKLIKPNELAEIKVPNFSVGKFENINIKIWYDPSLGGVNKKISRLLGYNISGDVIILCDNQDFTSNDFLYIEKLISEMKTTSDICNIIMDI
jgi:hypothetical protein